MTTIKNLGRGINGPTGYERFHNFIMHEEHIHFLKFVLDCYHGSWENTEDFTVMHEMMDMLDEKIKRINARKGFESKASCDEELTYWIEKMFKEHEDLFRRLLDK